MEKIYTSSLFVLLKTLKMIDAEIEKNMANPDKLEIYVDIRQKILNDIKVLNKDLKNMKFWEKHKS